MSYATPTEQNEPLLSQVTEPSPGQEVLLTPCPQSLPQISTSVCVLAQAVASQLRMAAPLTLNLLSVYALSAITLSFMGHLSTTDLAAVALSNALTGMFSKMVMMGLCGALDTLASQAFGAGNVAALSVVFQKSVLFLLAHSGLISVCLLTVPMILRKVGSDEQLTRMAGRYLALLLPYIWMDSLSIPLTRILVAQRITLPQMVISVVLLPIHALNNYIFVRKLHLDYLGAAVAFSLASLITIAALVTFIIWNGLSSRVWGRPRREALQKWVLEDRIGLYDKVLRLSTNYENTLMAELIMTLLAGLLPDSQRSVAAISVAFNIYGILFMGFVALSLTACAQIGNALGQGQPKIAKKVVYSACIILPFLTGFVTLILLEPHSQRSFIHIFTDGSDVKLIMSLKNLLIIVAALEAFDGVQTTMAGVIQGCGKQRVGLIVNAIAFYVFAIPMALLLAFRYNQGVQGMYLGLLLGPIIQVICYATIIYRIDWAEESKRASQLISISDPNAR